MLVIALWNIDNRFVTAEIVIVDARKMFVNR